MHAGGRPTKYRKRFCEDLIKFFDAEPYKIISLRTTTIRKKNGDVMTIEDKKPLANPMPTVQRFCDGIKISTQTFYKWVAERPEFSSAFTRAQEYRKEFLVTLGLTGIAPPASFIFVASNVTDMKPASVGDVPIERVVVPVIIKRGTGLAIDSPREEQPEMHHVSVKVLEHAKETTAG